MRPLSEDEALAARSFKEYLLMFLAQTGQTNWGKVQLSMQIERLFGEWMMEGMKDK